MIELFRQRRIIIWGSIVFLLISSYYVLHPFFLSLALGYIFALALTPVQEFILTKTQLKLKTTSAVVTLFACFFIFGPISFVLYKLLSYINENANRMLNPTQSENSFLILLKSVKTFFRLSIDSGTLMKLFEQGQMQLQQISMNLAKSTIAALPDSFVQLFIMFVTIFIVLLNHRQMTYRALETIGVSNKFINQVNVILFEICKDIVFANIITGFVQALLVTAGALFLTNLDPVLILVVTFVLSFIPVIGAAPVAVALAIYQLMGNQFASAASLFILSMVVGVSDNFIRAKLMGSKKDSSFLNFLACIGGIYVMGIPGVFMGPLLVTLTIRTIPLLLEEINKMNLNQLKLKQVQTDPALTPVMTNPGAPTT